MIWRKMAGALLAVCMVLPLAGSSYADSSGMDHVIPVHTTETYDEVAAENFDFPEIKNRAVLSGLDFSSKRLLVAAGESVIVDPQDIISEYDGMYLMKYASESDAKRAYAYYVDRADMAAPDIEFDTADGDIDGSQLEYNEKSNPLSELREAAGEDTHFKSRNMIALIDTGVSGTEVYDSVSMLGGDSSDDNGHGTKMAETIKSVCGDARILSVKALDAHGKGSAASVYAAIEYAILKDVKIINMSLYAYSRAENAIVREAVEKASRAGIMVVGAAGNDGKNVKYFVPGSIDEAIIAGACDEKGRRLVSSNYGDSIDCLVKADSTSEAAAKLSGFLAENSSYKTYAADIKKVFGKGFIFSAEDNYRTSAESETEAAVEYMEKTDIPREDGDEDSGSITDGLFGTADLKGNCPYVYADDWKNIKRDGMKAKIFGSALASGHELTSFKTIGIGKGNFSITGSSVMQDSLKVKKDSSPSTVYIIQSGTSADLFFKGAGVVDGNKCDVKISVTVHSNSNDHRPDVTGRGDGVIHVFSNGSVRFSNIGRFYDYRKDSYNGSVIYSMVVSFYKSGTDFNTKITRNYDGQNLKGYIRADDIDGVGRENIDKKIYSNVGEAWRFYDSDDNSVAYTDSNLYVSSDSDLAVVNVDTLTKGGQGANSINQTMFNGTTKGFKNFIFNKSGKQTKSGANGAVGYCWTANDSGEFKLDFLSYGEWESGLSGAYHRYNFQLTPDSERSEAIDSKLTDINTRSNSINEYSDTTQAYFSENYWNPALMNVQGYSFEGWKTGTDMNENNFSGDSVLNVDKTLYGSYSLQTGSVRVKKVLTGSPVPDGFNKFTFRISPVNFAADGLNTAANKAKYTRNITVTINKDDTAACSQWVVDMPLGTYKIEETDGATDTDRWKFISADNIVLDTAGGTAEGTVTNRRNTGYALAVKTVSDTAVTDDSGKQTGASLSGYRLVLKNSSGKTVAAGTTDINGKVDFGEQQIGTYTVDEELTPEQSAFMSKQSPQTIIIKAGETRSVSFVNRIKVGEIVVAKSVEPAGWVKDLSGFVFNVSGRAECGAEVYRSAVTDMYGKAYFKNLPVGTYTVSENSERSGENGHLMESYKIPLTTGSVTVTDGQSVVWNALNKINLHKVYFDKRDDNGLAVKNAGLRLIETSGEYPGKEIKSWTSSGTPVYVDIPEGDYRLEEVSVPEAYRHNDPVEFTVKLSKKDPGYDISMKHGSGVSGHGKYILEKNEYADGLLLVDQDEPYLCTATVTKRVKASDVYNFTGSTLKRGVGKTRWSSKTDDAMKGNHGNPVFIFHLTGTDKLGNIVSRYAVMEFTRDYVEKHTGSDGYVTMSYKWTDLYPGDDYKITEEETLRYKLTEITHKDNDIAKDSVTGRCSVFKLGKTSSQKIEVIFTNEKYEWGDYSDSSAVSNRIYEYKDDKNE